jgi:sugar lactone lactonase YvrE
MSNRRVFSDISATEYGYPDGLCLDNQGGVWTARWSAGKVLRLNPKTAEIDVEIDIPSSWNVTCCIFGGTSAPRHVTRILSSMLTTAPGENLDVLYITTARCSQSGDSPPDRTELGKLYCIEGLGYRGVERGRFQGTF